jgi:hypothetical protein
MATVARALARVCWVRQRRKTYRDLDDGVEEPALILVLMMDFLRPKFHRMVKRRLGGETLEFPVPQHSPLCGIKRAARCAGEPAQVTERGDEEVYRVLSEWT